MISFKIKGDWGDSFYLKNDPEQLEKTLIGIYLSPGQITYNLRSGEDIIEVFDFEVTNERDEVKRLKSE